MSDAAFFEGPEAETELPEALFDLIPGRTWFTLIVSGVIAWGLVIASFVEVIHITLR